MRAAVYLILAVLSPALFSGCAQQGGEFTMADFAWEFRHADSAGWLPASVPGCTHLDLLDNGLIPEPFYRDNELQLQWVGESIWEYRTGFEGKDLMGRENVELVFEGLDTYADVYLNGTLLFQADNMFRTWTASVGGLLEEGINNLSVRFFPPEEIEQAKASRMDHALPDSRGLTRKAPYQYGWDWGPKFLTAGIWKQVYLRTWDQVRIADVKLFMEGLDRSEARYAATLLLEAQEAVNATARVFIEGREDDGARADLRLHAGLNRVMLPVSVHDPELWWPAGLGAQPLYTFRFEVATPAERAVREVRTGIRTAELVREPDSLGESFFFRINGVPVFMKGANYIPQDNFLPRVSGDDYRRVLQSALDANMNMLRVWGGGVYENDIFYELCDEKGILVWQDFMFACNMYPGDSAFVENVRREAVDQVRRLRDHPSVVLWCGNNEVDEGWHNWGWQEALGYSPEDSAEVWADYVRVFHELIPSILAEESPVHPYVPSSPRIGWGHEEAMFEGDMHYWGVWWGEEPFEVYEAKVGRFMSEFGFQGFPDIRTLSSAMDADDLQFGSKVLGVHQKHPRGMEVIRMYMERDFPVPANFSDYVYVSQLVQARGMRMALEAHRRAMPRCMGTLYWQLNDCWPVISWSGIDHDGRWKALHYAVRDAYADYLVSFEERQEGTAVFIVSDKKQETKATLQLQVMDFDGNLLGQETQDVLLPANSSREYHLVPTGSADRRKSVLSASLLISGERVAGNLHYFVPPVQLHLSDEEVSLEAVMEGDRVMISISSGHLAKNVWLSCSLDGFFSNNYFDLLPGIPAEVEFFPRRPGPVSASDFHVQHLGRVQRDQ